MRACRAALLTLIFSLTFAMYSTAPALAQVTPVVQNLKVNCGYQAGQMYTVTLTMQWQPAMQLYEFLFTSSQGQQKRFYESMNAMGTGNFMVPQGTHTLTVTIVTRPNATTVVRVPNTGKAIYDNIVVPQPVSTQGRGTGCRFA